MKKNVLVTVSGIAILGGIAWFGAHHAERVMVDKGIERFKQALGPDVSFTYTRAKPGLLGRSVRFSGLVFRQGPETMTADEAELTKPDTQDSDVTRIHHLSFRNFQLADPAGSLHLKTMEMDDLALPTKAEDPTAPGVQTLSIGHAQATGLHGFVSALQSDLSADSASMDDFGANETSHLQARNVQLSTDVAPPRHIKAESINVDGVALADLYKTLTTGAPYTTHANTRDITIDQLSMDGTTPLIRAKRVLSHATHTESTEQEVSSIQGLELWPNVPNMGWMPSLGYDHFVGNVVLNDTHTPKTGALHLETLSIDSANMGRLHIHGELGQATSASVLVDSNTDMQVISLSLDYIDHGLVPKALGAIAAARGLPPQGLLAYVQAQSATAQNPAFASFFHWLANPGKQTLSITLKPVQPMPLMLVAASLGELTSMPELAQKIGLSVQAH
ncbi:MAG: hypothetical protein LKH76_05595 [Acetobacter fabarum]|uniref:hypothetical protein n=1 Tax=Acetobacter fabarum TaxID=483199 RepID=UPI00242F77C0|nr:hypothetical protein [Acetobacter fabarum]MCH4025163.1 hypothetical protein [Acetobacter fabarum]MCH4055188.1 hypothetical protein [Acetobacter fabarum]MCH4128009.1 hypothetical protein [Acetobacter fabarum]MCH4141220.1 hypothetical protein [Acetobacter fabarum]MCI1297333.1 hypothetical protein [Acetobacter fabarum]